MLSGLIPKSSKVVINWNLYAFGTTGNSYDNKCRGINYVIIGPKTSVNYAAKVLLLFELQEFILEEVKSLIFNDFSHNHIFRIRHLDYV